MASPPSAPTRMSSTRTFHPFKRLPKELRFKIWQLRFADSPRIVDFIIDERDTRIFLTLRHDSEGLFNGFKICQEAVEEMLRCLKLEEGVRNSLGRIELKEPPLDETNWVPNPDLSKGATLLIDDQFRYSRDIARFETQNHIQNFEPSSFPTSFVILSNLRHIILDEFTANVWYHPRNPPASPVISIGSALWTLPKICALQTMRITKLRGIKTGEGIASPSPSHSFSQNEIEIVIRQLKITLQQKWPWGLHYNVPEVTVSSYSSIPIYGPNGPSAYPTGTATSSSS